MSYYYSYDSSIRTNRKKGERPARFSNWQYSFEADTCAHLYSWNLPTELKGAVWRCCPIADFYNHFSIQMQSLSFLIAYLRHPRLEHLVKTGFYEIASDLAYHYHPDCLDETPNRTHRMKRPTATAFMAVGA